MTEAKRRAAAERFRALLDQGIWRKAAVLQVVLEVRARGGRCSRTRLYAWCEQFGISTR